MKSFSKKGLKQATKSAETFERLSFTEVMIMTAPKKPTFRRYIVQFRQESEQQKLG